MLKDDFYTIVSKQKENNSFKIELQLNPTHSIYAGHFPNQPVVPGACMLQMVKEVAALMLEKELQLKKADNMKFLSMINPHENNILQMSITTVAIEDGNVNVIASLSNGTSVCFRFNGTFKSL